MSDTTSTTTTTTNEVTSTTSEVTSLAAPATIYTGIKISQLSAYPSKTLKPDDLFLISKCDNDHRTYTSYKINY